MGNLMRTREARIKRNVGLKAFELDAMSQLLRRVSRLGGAQPARRREIDTASGKMRVFEVIFRLEVVAPKGMTSIFACFLSNVPFHAVAKRRRTKRSSCKKWVVISCTTVPIWEKCSGFGD